MNRSNTIKVILLLVVVFLISVLIRTPNINRPLSKHHEFITAMPLRVLQIWDVEGASKFHFNPVMNYSGSANKFINNNASTSGKMIDDEGNSYYVSQAQFAYIFPHLVFKLFQIKPTVLSLEIFHLVINFFSAAFIYLIVCLLSIQKPFKKIFIPGLVAYIVYLFSPGVLWFQCNTYTSDTLVHLPFILAVYTMLKLLMRKRFYSSKYLFYYTLFLFLMIYTSWLGLFFAFTVFLYSIIKLRKESVFLPLIFITLSVSFFTLMLIVYQYSQINGLQSYVIEMIEIFENNVHFINNSLLNYLIVKKLEIKIITTNYLTSYLPIFMLLGFFGFLTIKKAKMFLVFTKNGYRFLWLSTLPVLFLHFFLAKHSSQDFVMLYGSLFLSVLLGILYDKLKRGKTLSNFTLNAGIILVIVSSIGMYYYINRPGDFSWKKEYYATSKEIGEFIKTDAKPDEVVFVDETIELEPQLIVYAERNILRPHLVMHESLLKKKKVVYFKNKNGQIVSERDYFKDF